MSIPETPADAHKAEILNTKQRDQLRALAHSLKPVVSIGQSGASAAVIAETDLALDHHELIKIRLPAIDRKERKELLTTVAEQTSSSVVQVVGRIGTLYRRSEKGVIALVK